MDIFSAQAVCMHACIGLLHACATLLLLSAGCHATRHKTQQAVQRAFAAQDVEPFVLADATVTGPASASVQAAFDAEYEAPLATIGGLRGLLHGRRRPGKWAKCSHCTMVSCRGSNCSGHCRARRKVFDCFGDVRDIGFYCPIDHDRDLSAIAISGLRPPDSVVVTAPSPYIGCARIADQASGCPAPGTRGRLPAISGSAAEQYEVGVSTCATQRYSPGCTRPLYPFGICLCSRIALDGRSLSAGPCIISELDITNAPPGRGEGRVIVEARGAVCYTGFSDYTEPSDTAKDIVSLLVSEATLVADVNSKPELFEGASEVSLEVEGGITVTLEVFEGAEPDVGDGGVMGEEEGSGSVSDDYYDDTDSGEDIPSEIGTAIQVKKVPRATPRPDCATANRDPLDYNYNYTSDDCYPSYDDYFDYNADYYFYYYKS